MNKITAANLYWHFLFPATCIILTALFSAALSGCGSIQPLIQVVPQTQIVPVTQVIPVTQIVQLTQAPTATRRPVPAGSTAAPMTTRAIASTNVVVVSARQGWQDSGIALAAGSQASISYVVGAWDLDFGGASGGYVGPDGVPLPPLIMEACDPPPLPESPTGALVGEVGNGPAFLVGSRLSFQVQQNGDLFFRINDGCLANNDGNIVVQVDRFDPSQPPASPADASPDPAAIRFTVSADKPSWQGSGIVVERGQKVVITYVYGVWSFNLRGGSKYFVGPAGYPYNYTSVLSGKCGSLPLPGAPFGALLARLGGSAPFVTGLAASFQAERNGELSYRINDDCMGDDWGQITVSVALEK